MWKSRRCRQKANIGPLSFEATRSRFSCCEDRSAQPQRSISSSSFAISSGLPGGLVLTLAAQILLDPIAAVLAGAVIGATTEAAGAHVDEAKIGACDQSMCIQRYSPQIVQRGVAGMQPALHRHVVRGAEVFGDERRHQKHCRHADTVALLWRELFPNLTRIELALHSTTSGGGAFGQTSASLAPRTTCLTTGASSMAAACRSRSLDDRRRRLRLALRGMTWAVFIGRAFSGFRRRGRSALRRAGLGPAVPMPACSRPRAWHRSRSASRI